MLSSRRVFLEQLGLGAGVLTFGTAFTHHAFGSLGRALPRSTPEAEGVASSGIQSFLEAMAGQKHELHSLMVVRHGRVVAEGWSKPYGAPLRHTLYSMSKSFTSTAVGLAVAEGKLTVEDKVISFFPVDLPETVSENLAALQVKHLLTMSVGNEKEPTHDVVQHENWVKAFLAAPITHPPGTVFQYNSTATYMCSAIVQHVTGQKVIDYLTPRLFSPLGLEGMTWETCPRGINTGGWGLSIQTEGLASFGQLYLQEGKWEGRQIIPAAWVKEATSKHIQQPEPAKPTRPKEQNDWLQGYGYQFWRCQHDAFRGDGAFGQYTIVLPEKNAVIAITGESSNMQGELDLVWEHLLPAFKDAALPEDDAALRSLSATLASLALPPPTGQFQSAITSTVSGKAFQFEANNLGLENVTFDFGVQSVLATFQGHQQTYHINNGFGEWTLGETALPGTPPRLISGGAPPAGMKSKIAAGGAWQDGQTLDLIWRYYETPHHDTVTCHFEGDKISVTFRSSFAKGKDQRPILKGQLKT